MAVNFHLHLSLAQVAAEAGMSISCFERHLRQKTGMNFTSYVNCLRIAKAKELIRADHASLLKIALACGFSNQSDFNRVFKKNVKVSPGNYRRSMPAVAVTAPSAPLDPFISALIYSLMPAISLSDVEKIRREHPEFKPSSVDEKGKIGQKID